MKARLIWCVLFFLWAMFAYALLASDGFERVAKVTYFPSYDVRGIETYQLNFGTEGTVTILADDDLDLAKLLKHATKVRVVIQAIPREALTR